MKELWIDFKETILCGVLIVIATLFSMPFLYLLAIAIGGYKQTLEGLKDSVENKHLNVELLMILSAVGACLIGYYSEGAILIFIFSLAGAMEDRTVERSQKEIRALMELQPTEASKVLENGELETVSVQDLQIGDHVRVSAGEIVPIDAVIMEGQTSLEEAAITGESMPKSKGLNDQVFGGTVNITNPITVRVENEIKDTLIQKIVRMVEEAQNYPSKTAQFIEKFEDIYARIVIISVIVVIAFLTLVLKVPFDSAFYRGMILLVVASPCALIASVTPATLSAISNGARNGILVKGGMHFERLVETKAVAFDKTGTITKGLPELNDVYLVEEADILLPVIRVIEQYSTHPLANALVQGIDVKASGEQQIVEIEEVAGNGVKGMYQGKEIRVGKQDFVKGESMPCLEHGKTWSLEGQSLVYVSYGEEMVGVFGFMDKIRPESKKLIEWLHTQGIQTIMITGDNAQTAQIIGEAVGIDRILAETLPDQKASIVKKLEDEYQTVVMVGDGINDAPALANASVGIAMGSGTDIAMEAADIILVKDDVSQIRLAIELSTKLRRVVKQNIIFSVSVIVVLIIANFMQVMNLPLGVVGHEGSTILVVLNSLRLLRTIETES